VSKRIQRRRTRGWRMPEGAIYVGRPTRWGNPFPPERYGYDDDALAMYEAHVRLLIENSRPDFIEPLRGKDLACWCKPSMPCHADVLLKLLGETEVPKEKHHAD
jgi:hypothetical protein